MRYAAEFAKAGADLYCFHYEAAVKSTIAKDPADEASKEKVTPKGLIKYIHELGMSAGIAIKPDTKVDVLWEILDNDVKEEVPDVCYE